MRSKDSCRRGSGSERQRGSALRDSDRSDPCLRGGLGFFKRGARCRARVAPHPAWRPPSPGGRRVEGVRRWRTLRPRRTTPTGLRRKAWGCGATPGHGTNILSATLKALRRPRRDTRAELPGVRRNAFGVDRNPQSIRSRGSCRNCHCRNCSRCNRGLCDVTPSA